MSLANLIKLQQQKTKSETPKAEMPKVESESQAPEVLPATATVAKPSGLRLNLLKPGQSVGAKTLAADLPRIPKPSTDEVEFSLESLAMMDAGSVPEVQTREAQIGSGYEDEIEATAPDRDLPEGLEAEQLSFVATLDGIYGVLHDPDLFGQSVRLIMIELQDNPEYEKLLSDSDVHVMIRGMRRTMGLARVRKQEKSRKPATQKAARKKAGVSDDVLGMLSTLMGDDDD